MCYEPTLPPAAATDVAANTAAISALQSANTAQDTEIVKAKTYNWTWTSSAQRLAQAVTAADVGAIGFQSGIDRIYRLISQSGGVGRWGELPDPRTGAFPPLEAHGALNGAFVNKGLTFTNTASARQPTNTNVVTALPRVVIVTAGTAGSVISALRPGGGGVTCGQGVRWRVRTVLMNGDLTATSRWCAGIYQDSAATPTAQDYTALVNEIMVGRPVGNETNLKLFHNDGSGSATVVDLGASFPAAAGASPIGYELDLLTYDSLTWFYNVRHMVTGAETSGTLSTNLPGPTTQMNGTWSVNNNTDAAVARLDPTSISLEMIVR